MKLFEVKEREVKLIANENAQRRQHKCYHPLLERNATIADEYAQRSPADRYNTVAEKPSLLRKSNVVDINASAPLPERYTTVAEIPSLLRKSNVVDINARLSKFESVPSDK